MTISISRRGFAGLGLASLLPSVVSAQAAWPDRQVRLIVPFGAGGAVDTLSRLVANGFAAQANGQAMVVENRSGANTGIGAEMVAKAAPDGHTLLFTNDATFVANPVLYAKLPYNVQRDFTPVAAVTYVALALAVNTVTPVQNMRELATYMRSRRDLSYGSFGAGIGDAGGAGGQNGRYILAEFNRAAPVGDGLGGGGGGGLQGCQCLIIQRRADQGSGGF